MIRKFNFGSVCKCPWTHAGTCCIAGSGLAPTGILPWEYDENVEDQDSLPSTVYSSVEENQELERIISASIPETPHGSAEPVGTIGPSLSTSFHDILPAPKKDLRFSRR
jgi:hypothetical protein